jgi:L-2,4-diaminobutyric acid acetyltransferase
LTESTHLSKVAPATIQFSHLTPLDGAALHRLIELCPPLDTNSAYCNLLQSSHFAATSMAARAGGDLLGSITAYRIPERPDTLFVWQVAVHPQAQRQGIGQRMLRALLASANLVDIRFVETTITEDNSASWRLFLKFADESGAATHRSIMFERNQHFAGQHDSEQLLRIGPSAKSGFATINQGVTS